MKFKNGDRVRFFLYGEFLPTKYVIFKIDNSNEDFPYILNGGPGTPHFRAGEKELVFYSPLQTFMEKVKNHV